MSFEKQIDLLINTGWAVLESDFDESAFRQWRRNAYECVVALMGNDHAYAEQLKSKLNPVNAIDVLEGVGILIATTSVQSSAMPNPVKTGMGEINRKSPNIIATEAQVSIALH